MGGNQGFSLIGAVVAVAIISIAIVTMSKAFVMHMKSTKNLSIKNDRESIKVMLMHKIDCGSTFKNDCKAGDLITVSDGKNNTIIHKSIGATFGDFRVRAECGSFGDSLIIRVTRMKSSGSITSTNPDDFLPHPMFNTKTMWSDPKSLLFLPGIDMCGETGKSCAVDTGNGLKIGWYKNGKCEVTS